MTVFDDAIEAVTGADPGDHADRRQGWNNSKAPFPYAGGKSKAAPLIWELLGDPAHYVEPFAGSLATLLARPATPNRPYHSETVNDADGLLVNAWRSIQLSPWETAVACSWPVTEADLHARHVALIRWREERQLEHLMGDPSFHDPVMAGWWIWGAACWIGSGWCASEGPWWPDDDDRLTKWKRDDPDRPGVFRKRPHLTDDGREVNSPQLREPGVSRQVPHLTDGRGVNSPGLREPGLPPDLTMPRLVEWFEVLSARLRHVRVCNGDWKRVVGSGSLNTLAANKQNACSGVFLDPPYADTADRAAMYAVEDFDVAHAVREWCLTMTESKHRVVLAGFEGEHGTELVDAGWTEWEWYQGGFLRGGYGNTGRSGNQQHRERLWANPACLTPAGQEPAEEGTLFEAEAA